MYVVQRRKFWQFWRVGGRPRLLRSFEGSAQMRVQLFIKEFCCSRSSIRCAASCPRSLCLSRSRPRRRPFVLALFTPTSCSGQRCVPSVSVQHSRRREAGKSKFPFRSAFLKFPPPRDTCPPASQSSSPSGEPRVPLPLSVLVIFPFFRVQTIPLVDSRFPFPHSLSSPDKGSRIWIFVTHSDDTGQGGAQENVA